jgi:hypothetical protein
VAREPVPALHLGGRCSGAKQPVQPRQAQAHQRVLAGGARGGDGARDAAAGRGDLQIRGAPQAHLELVHSRSSVYQVGVRVDESGHHHAAPPVDHHRAVRRAHLIADLRGRAHGDDLPVRGGHRPIPDHADLAERRPRARPVGRPREGQELRGVLNQEVGGLHPS